MPIKSIADAYQRTGFSLGLNKSISQKGPHLNAKVRKRAKIRNRYNQAPHLTQDSNGKVTTSQLDITNESQDVSPFPAGDHKASIIKLDLTKLIDYVNNKVPDNTYFNIPGFTTEQVVSVINSSNRVRWHWS